MSVIYSVIGFLLAISVLVAVHEFGHFWVARKLGVKVLRFSIGFGKPLWKKVAGEDQIEYVIAAIPLGGYVKMLGQGEGQSEQQGEDAVAEHEAHRAFDRQAIWKRTLIVLAGPGINFIFAIVLFTLLGMQTQQRAVPQFGDLPSHSSLAQAGVQAGDELVSIDGRVVDYMWQHDWYIVNQVLKAQPLSIAIRSGEQPAQTIVLDTSQVPIYNINPASLMYQLGFIAPAPFVNAQIDSVSAGSAAERAGLQAGDTVLSVNQTPIQSWQQLVAAIKASSDAPLQLLIERAGQTSSLSVIPEIVDVQGQQIKRIGIRHAPVSPAPEQIVQINRSPSAALGYGIERTWLMSSLTVRMLWKMLTLQVSHKNVSGPITIADVAGQAIQISWQTYALVLALISVSLGVMNLLPIPMLDGGHLLNYAVEAVAGRDIANKFFAVGQQVGLLMLICLMSLAFYNDIFRLLN